MVLPRGLTVPFALLMMRPFTAQAVPAAFQVSPLVMSSPSRQAKTVTRIACDRERSCPARAGKELAAGGELNRVRTPVVVRHVGKGLADVHDFQLGVPGQRYPQTVLVETLVLMTSRLPPSWAMMATSPGPDCLPLGMVTVTKFLLLGTVTSMEVLPSLGVVAVATIWVPTGQVVVLVTFPVFLLVTVLMVEPSGFFLVSVVVVLEGGV